MTLRLAGLMLMTSAAMAAEPPLNAFPAADAGQTRYVITLPARDDEADHQVELVAGRIMETDGVNQVRLDTVLNAQTLEGWGYTFYRVTGHGNAMSTLMAPPPDTPMVERFVGGTPVLVRYNSRLPIVVYAPDEIEVRYRVWRASSQFTPAQVD